MKPLTLTVTPGQCTSGKTRYPDALAALSAANAIAREGRGNAEPYRCPDCDAYHIGRRHKNSRWRRRLR